jgi:hypothetical protein
MRSTGRCTRLLVGAFGVCLALTSLVFAQAHFAQRRVGLSWSGGVPHVSVSLADLADARVRRSLESGLRKSVVITAQAYAAGSNRLLATSEQTCSITYDLWEDAYVVRAGRRTSVHRTLDSVIDACLVLRRFAIGELHDFERISGRDIYFAFRGEFNPITRARCRRLLGNAGSDDPIGPVVVNIVRREICQAERAIEFRSQAVRVP